MKTKIYLVRVAIILLMGFLFFTCKDNTVSPGALDNLETRFLSGYISADLMPVIPPDPIFCQLVLLAKNKSLTSSLVGLSIPEGDMFLNSTNARLGTISFSTIWDGQLGPNEEDTLRLSKVMSKTSLFTPSCEQYVYLHLTIKNQSIASKTLKIDSLLFTCTY